MAQESTHQRKATSARQAWPVECGREQTVPVILVTPHGIEHLSFSDGDEISIAIRGGRLVLQLGRGK